MVVFIRGEIGEIPDIALPVVVINPVIYNGLYLLKSFTFFQIDLVLHVTEEALLRSIVPAVAASRHGLAKVGILQNLNELVAGVVNALIGMDDGFSVKRDAMIPD